MVEIIKVFLKLGFTSFGGPIAHIAMMQREVVERRRWLTQQEFLRLIAWTHLVPGPNSTELALHIGFERHRWLGLIAAGLSFILPAAGIVCLLGFLYTQYGHLPTGLFIFNATKPAVMGIITHALIKFSSEVCFKKGNSTTKTKKVHGRALLTTTAMLLMAISGLPEILLIASAMILTPLLVTISRRKKKWLKYISIFGFINIIWQPLVLLAQSPTATLAQSHVATLTHKKPYDLTSLFTFFFKVGSILFGSGYVLIGYLKSDLVDQFAWLTESQLLDAITIGQFTPGPLFTTATFIGFLLNGLPGAGLATLGIFLPSFFFVALSCALLKKLPKSETLDLALEGAQAASLAIMAYAGGTLIYSAGLHSTQPVLELSLFFGTLLLLLTTNLNSAWFIVFSVVFSALWPH